MKHIITVYKAPLLISVMLMVILCAWGVFEQHQVNRYRTETLRRHSGGVFNSLEGIVNSLNKHASYNIKHLQIMLNGVLKTTGLLFVYITQDGNTIVTVGSVPHTFTTPGPSGEQLEQNIFLTWRPIRLKRTTATYIPSLTDNPASVQTLVLGLSTTWKADEHDKRILNLFFKLGGGVLITLAIGAVWILTIHSRNLRSELAMERMKRAHFEELGLAAAGLAHEAKNPLGIIRGFAQRLSQNQASDTDQKETADHIIDAVDRTSARLGEFMVYAKFRKPKIVSVNGAEVAERVKEILDPDYNEKTVTLSIDAEPVLIRADEEMFRQAIVNLLLNSLHASEKNSTVTLCLQKTKADITCIVEDEGTGIDPDLLPDVCKPYVSGTDGGHGMGLAIVKRIADQHGWGLEIISAEGKGTKAAITGIKGTAS